MPDWGSAASVQKWLDDQKKKNGDYGKAEQQQKAKDAKIMGPRERPDTPAILKPLVTGQPVARPDTYRGWNEADANSGTGRRRQEPQVRQRTPTVAPRTSTIAPRTDDRTRLGDWSQSRNRWGASNPTEVADELARQRAEEDAAKRKESIDFTSWKRVKQSSALPGLPSAVGDVFDWFGAGNTEAAKWADTQDKWNREDDKPELFPTYDAINNAVNQAGALTNLITTTPFIPTDANDRKILGTTDPDAKLTVAELVNSVGQTLNRTFNPFNPNAKLGQGAENQKEALAAAKDLYQFRTSIPNMPKAQQEIAWRAYTVNAQSNTAPQTYEQIANREKNAADAKRKMEAAQASGDATAAARWGEEFNKYSKQTEMDIIQENMNSWAEMIYGVTVDPVDWVTGPAMTIAGLTPRLVKTAQAANKFNVGEEATSVIDDALKAAEPVLNKIGASEGIGNSTWKYIFTLGGARTHRSQADKARAELTAAASIVFSGITNKVDAKTVMRDWVETGGKNLVQGLPLQMETTALTDANNAYRVGAGVLANKDVLKQYPVLAASKNELLSMKSLEGMDEFKPSEFIKEFYKVTGENLNKFYQIKDPGKLAQAVSFPARLLRAAASDMYLNLTPRNWIRNAASAGLAATADGTFSFRPLTDIENAVAKKTGGMPIDMGMVTKELLGEGTSQTTLLDVLGLGKTGIGKKYNAVVKGGAEIWGGDTTIPASGGRMPLGENAFRKNVSGTTMLRAFNEFWGDAVTRQFMPDLAAAVGPDMARRIADEVIEVGRTGSKEDLADALRKMVGNVTVKENVASKVPDEAMPIEYRKALQDIVNGFTPEREQEARAAIRELFEKVRRPAAQIINAAPPTWTPSITKTANVQDAQEIMTGLVGLAKKAGMPGDIVNEASTIVGDVLRTENMQYGRFLKDLASNPDPKAMNFAFDTWGRVYDLKQTFRKNSDNIYRVVRDNIAKGAPAAEEYAKAYQQVAQNWQAYGKKFGEVMEQSRAALLDPNVGSAAKFDWNTAAKKYMEYDADLLEQARRLEPGAVKTGVESVEAVIEANRQFVDHAYTELFSTFKAMPNADSFDIIAGVMRQADAMGASAWTEVRKAADAAVRSNDWDTFYATRNAIWREVADDTVDAIQAAKRGVVWNYIAEQVPSKLKWSDDFAGDYQLLGPSDKVGIWYAKQADGRTVTLAEEGFNAGKVAPMKPSDVDATFTTQGRTAAQAQRAVADQYESGGSGITVPKNIIADYNRLVNGDVEKNIDEVLDAIPGAVTPKPTAVAPSIASAVPDVVRTTATAVAPRTALRVVTAQELDTLRSTANTIGVAMGKNDNALRQWLANNTGIVVKKLDELTGEQLPKVIDAMAQRAAEMGRNVAQATDETVPAVGKQVQIWSDPARKYAAEYDIVELDDLVASNDVDGFVNPRYPAELQPRDRSQLSAKAQVQTMAQQLDPAELLSDTNALDRGSPIINNGNVVLSGNGRTMAMRLADAGSYSQYRNELLQRAQQLGIDPAKLDGIKKPVLVRRLTTDTDMAQFAKEANARTTLAYNAVETAKMLASKVTTGDMVGFDAKGTDNLRQALSLFNNAEFVNRILGKLPDVERAALVGPGGELTAQGVDAIRATLFSVVFPNSDAMLRNFVLSPKPELANVGNAIERTIGKLAQVKLQNPDLSIGEELADAAMTLLKARNDGVGVQTVLKQAGLFGDMAPETKALLEFLDENLRTSRNISAALSHYADSALTHLADQAALFAGGEANKLDMLTTAINRVKSGDQGELFEMQGGLGPMLRSARPDWAAPAWDRGSLWNKPTVRGAFNFKPEDDAYKAVKQGIQQARYGKGAPEIGDAAVEQLRHADQLEKYILDNLPQILAGAPNTLTPAQRVQVLDLAAQKLMPTWDNVLAASSEAGKKMGDFAMLNFQDRRGFDIALSYVLPFHYYWTRSAKNWAQRVAANPWYLDFYNETNQAIATENQQNNVAPRLRGTVPNPLAQIQGTAGWMPERLGNPLDWILPFNMYVMGQYTDQPARGEGETDEQYKTKEFANMVVDYVASRGFPYTQAAAAAMMDQFAPLPEGERPRLEQWKAAQQLGDYLPHARAAYYGLQAAGVVGQPPSNFFSLGDEWDPYLAGRQIRNMVQEGKTGPLTETAQYAQQMILNVQQGKPVEAGIPADQVEAARAIYDKAIAAEGYEKFARTTGAMLTGINSQFYPQAEKDYRAGADKYYNYGYSPDNLGGSKEARDAARDATPALQIQGGKGWGQAALVPGATDAMPPAVSADRSLLYDKVNALSEERDAAATAAGEAVAAAGGTTDALYDARNAVYAKYRDEIDGIYKEINAINEQYSRAEDAASPVTASTADGATFEPKAVRTTEEVTAGVYPKGMNPTEFKEVQTVDVYKEASAKFPRLPDSSSWDERNANSAAKEQFVVDGLVALGYTADEAKKMYEENKVRDLSEAEKGLLERNKQAGEARDAMWAARGNWVTDAFGGKAFDTWDAYYDLPEGDARKAYKAAHPEMKAYDLAAYQPDGYKFLTDTYGTDSIMAWAKAPAWSEDKAQQAVRAAYMDANPNAWMVGAWVTGRPEVFDPDAKTERNYGKDFEQAKVLFGADIWDKVYQYKGSNKQKGLFKELGLQDWNDWWYSQLPELEQRSILPAYVFRSGGGRAFYNGGGGGGGGGGYSGGRPYIQQIDPRYMDRDLEVNIDDIKAWRSKNNWRYTSRANWR